MNTYIREIEGKQFIVSELVPVYQKNHRFYITKMPAKFLIDTYVVQPVEYNVEKESALANSFPEYGEYFQSRIDMNKARLRDRKFERKEDIKRIREIAKFLHSEEYALFPNTIIVTCELINDSIDFEEGESVESLVSKNLVNLPLLWEASTDGGSKMDLLFIPYQKKQLLIIDGQHRLRGIEEASEEVQSNYEVLMSFLLGFDKATIARQFYTINYTQKSVNKSLLYHLRGEFSYELNEITFMHETVKLLNEVAKSPFYKRIKMLGTADGETPPEERKYMTISQAFLIDCLINTISKKAENSLHPPIFLYYYKKKEDIQIEIIRYLIKYFDSIKQLMPNEWNDPENSVISKTISTGAFIRVMYYLFIKTFIDDEFAKNPLRIQEVEKESIMDKLDGIQKVDFSSKGEYGKTASGGSLNKLRAEIVEKMAYFGHKPYDDFLSEYRASYLRIFRDWVSAV